MQTAKELDFCLKLFAQAGSDLGDGENAALKLQERMERNRMGFEDLFDYVCEHERDYAYQAERFFLLTARIELAGKSTSPWRQPEPTVTAPPESEISRVHVREQTRTSRNGKVFTVRPHWRHCRRRAHRYDWRKDPSAMPGDDYEWIEGHERWYCHAGHGRMIRVRGYWRKRVRITVRTAA